MDTILSHAEVKVLDLIQRVYSEVEGKAHGARRLGRVEVALIDGDSQAGPEPAGTHSRRGARLSDHQDDMPSCTFLVPLSVNAHARNRLTK